MGSLFTFALGAVSAMILVPVFVNSRQRHRHSHGGPMKGVTTKKSTAKKTVSRKSVAKDGKKGK